MKLNVREIAVFGMLGAMMYASKMLMEILPNIHLIGTFIVAMTVVYRQKALYPIYVFVFITGLTNGFASWWVPYLYIWTVLWGAVMLLPKKMPKKIRPIAYSLVCALHGFLYGVLYAPAQALIFGLNFNGMIAWIAAGLPFDITHGISNLICGLLICPLIAVLRRSNKFTH
ncbi:MAG: hypothetical protein IJ261_06030 [Clostridia bacterium]|nr:hypothetical protein [Clostridia bacterium]